MQEYCTNVSQSETGGFNLLECCLSDDVRRGCERLHQAAEEQTDVEQEEEKFPAGLPPSTEPGARHPRQSQSLSWQERLQTGKTDREIYFS